MDSKCSFDDLCGLLCYDRRGVCVVCLQKRCHCLAFLLSLACVYPSVGQLL